jgi:prophage regulatory protein
MFNVAPRGTNMVTTILRLPAVKTRISLSRSTIYDKLDPKSERHDPTFPKPVSLGGRAVGWIESEIQQWLERQIEASRNAAA